MTILISNGLMRRWLGKQATYQSVQLQFPTAQQIIGKGNMCSFTLYYYLRQHCIDCMVYLLLCYHHWVSCHRWNRINRSDAYRWSSQQFKHHWEILEITGVFCIVRFVACAALWRFVYFVLVLQQFSLDAAWFHCVIITTLLQVFHNMGEYVNISSHVGHQRIVSEEAHKVAINEYSCECSIFTWTKVLKWPAFGMQRDTEHAFKHFYYSHEYERLSRKEEKILSGKMSSNSTSRDIISICTDYCKLFSKLFLVQHTTPYRINIHTLYGG